MAPRYAFVILHFNSPEILGRLLDSIEKYGDKTAGIIVIDSNSSTKHREELQRLLATAGFVDHEKQEGLRRSVLLAENVGFSRGNNLGVKLAQSMGCTFAIVANPDTELIDTKSVPQLIASLQAEPDAVCAFPEVLGLDGRATGSQQGPYVRHTRARVYLGDSVVERWLRMFQRPPGRPAELRKIFTSLGCFFAVNIAHFLRVGGFDEDFFLYYEEHVIGERVRKDGLCNLYDSRARIFHNHDFAAKQPNWTAIEKSQRLFLNRYKHFSPRELELFYAIKRRKIRINGWISRHFKRG